MDRVAGRTVDGALVLAAATLAVVIVRAASTDLEGASRAPDVAQLARNPLDLSALRELGLRLDRGGRLPQAEAILSFVGRRTWRDGPTEVWLLRRRLDQGRYREAFESADSLLRRDGGGTTRPILFDLLFAAADDPQARPALVARLAAAPWWRGDFLRALGTRSGAAGVRAVFSDLALGPAPPAPDEYAPLVDRLASAGDNDGAYGAWLAVGRHRSPSPAVIHDGDFTGASDHTPFTWSAASGVGASSEAVPAPDGPASTALRIDYDGYSAPSFPAQLLVRPPARYRLDWRERLDPPLPERLFWRVRCADTNQIIARAPPPTAGWREAAMVVETPGAGCAAQWLELTPEPGQRRAPVTGWYAAFRLRPIP